VKRIDSDLFLGYVKSLFFDIPFDVYKVTACVFVIGLVILIALKGFKTGLRYSAKLLLIEYIFLIFCSTVIFRYVGETRYYDFHPFWSYKAIQEGREDLLAENIMNVVAFVPVGLLLGIAFKQMTWWKALLIGCSISITIESLQFIFMRGFSELDDVMHNTLGCIVGFMIVNGFRHITAAVNHLHRAPRYFSVLC
jgi:glycopeptide antibiotics resistance protein